MANRPATPNLTTILSKFLPLSSLKVAVLCLESLGCHFPAKTPFWRQKSNFIYFWCRNDESKENLKEKIKREAENKKAVRDLEKERQKGGNTFMADSLLEEEESKNVSSISAMSLGTSQLNNLWERVRYFLNGKDKDGNDLNNKAIGRGRFTEICELKAMRGKAMSGVLPEKDVI